MDKKNIVLKDVSPIERKNIALASGEGWYREWGDGYPLVCLPGWPVSSLAFAPLAGLLSTEYRIIAIDFPGWAGTETGGRKMKRLDEYASYVEEVIGALGLKEFSLLGYSFGGIILQELLQRDKVEPESAFVVSSFHGWKRFSKDMHFRPGMKVYSTVLSMGMSDERIADALEWVYRMFFRAQPYYQEIEGTEIFEALVKESKEGDIRILYGAGESVKRKELLPDDHEKLDDPADKNIHVLWGSEDFKFIKEDSKEIAERYGSKTAVFAGVDHFHVFYRPGLTAEYVKKVL